MALITPDDEVVVVAPVDDPQADTARPARDRAATATTPERLRRHRTRPPILSVVRIPETYPETESQHKVDDELLA
jgi:hypothetical protein